MNLVDMVQVTTQIIGTIIAIIMAYLAWKTYLKKPHQEPEPAHTEDTEAEGKPDCAHGRFLDVERGKREQEHDRQKQLFGYLGQHP